MESEKSTSTNFLKRLNDSREYGTLVKQASHPKDKLANAHNGIVHSYMASSYKPEQKGEEGHPGWETGWISRKWHSNNHKQKAGELKRQHNKMLSACLSNQEEPLLQKQMYVSTSKRDLEQFAITAKVFRPSNNDKIKEQTSPMNLSTNLRKTASKKEQLSPKKELEVQMQQGKLRLHLINLKSNAHQIVAYYNRKCGLPSVPVFIFNSQDEYIRRILLHWGWSENKVLDSPFFNLKWSYKDTPRDYSTLVPGQLVNHFRSNQEMTSKGRLAINLRNSGGLDMPHNSYFPKCFDLGNPADQCEFRQQYERNVMYTVLKRLYEHVKLHLPEDQFNSLQTRMTERLDTKQKRLDVQPSGYSMEDGSFGLMRFEDHKHRRNDFLVQINLSVMVFRYLRHLKDKEKFCPRHKPNHILNFHRQSFMKSFARIQQYARMARPFQPSDHTDFTKQFYATPSALFIHLTIKYHTFFERLQGNLWQAAGNDGVWIVKPASNSRGNGIHLSRECHAILNTSQGITNRIVQKYIQRPLIFRSPVIKQLQNRKFDIRQWVLVTSYSPLRIFRFSQSYLRICSQAYDLQQIKQLQRHLTNYSFNKHKFSNQADSVASLDDLKTALQGECNVDYDTQLMPKIDAIIKEVIRRCSEHIKPSPHSFQMYGFDILIDEFFTPWLLEVNMSPACEQRCPFLKDYCEVMGQKMLRKVLPPQTIPSSIAPMSKAYGKYEWVPLTLERIPIVVVMSSRPAVETSRTLDCSPVRVDTEMFAQPIATEERSDSIKTQASELQNSLVRSNRRACVQQNAALTIQTFYKMIKAKRLRNQLRQQRAARTFETYLRGLAAQNWFRKHADTGNEAPEGYSSLSGSFIRQIMEISYSDKICSYLKAFLNYSQFQTLRSVEQQGFPEDRYCFTQQVVHRQPQTHVFSESQQAAVETIGSYIMGFLEYYYYEEKYQHCSELGLAIANPLNQTKIRRSFEKLISKQPLINHQALLDKYFAAAANSAERHAPEGSPKNPPKKRAYCSSYKKQQGSTEQAWDLTPYLEQRANFRKHSVKVRRPKLDRQQWQ